VGTFFRGVTIDNFLASGYSAIGAVAEKYKSCFWIAGDDVPENESGKVLESCKGILSVLN